MPVLLLSNIQSFDKSEGKDKTIEIEEVLILNNVEISVFSETWLTEETADRLPFRNYQKFHLIRINVARSSGGVSILVNNALPAKKLSLSMPDNLECIWVTTRTNWFAQVCFKYYHLWHLLSWIFFYLFSKKRVSNFPHHNSSTIFKRKYENPLFL